MPLLFSASHFPSLAEELEVVSAKRGDQGHPFFVLGSRSEASSSGAASVDLDV